MLSHTSTTRTTSLLENMLILGIGVTAGAIVALLLLGLALDTGQVEAGSPAVQLVSALDRLVHAAHERLTGEASLMGWPLTATTPAYWYMTRAGGLVSYGLLWAVTVWGLVLSTRLAQGLVPASFTKKLHQSLSLAALVFAAFHGLILTADRYVGFNLLQVVYPFAATYYTGWVGFGQVGFYLTAILFVSFYVREAITPKIWRLVHYLGFVTYVLVVVHAVTVGSDASTWPVQLMYATTGAAVAFLVYYRLFTLRSDPRRANNIG